MTTTEGRRGTSLIGLVCLALLACGAESEAPGPAARPHLLLLTADDLAFESVGVFQGSGPSFTPHLDRLALAGMRFSQAHVTVPVCKPTRAVWMTGLLPHHNGALGFQEIKAGVPTVVELLRDQGYRTGLLGKERHVVPSRREAWHQWVTSESLGHGRDPARFAEETGRFLDQALEDDAPFFLMVNFGDPHRPFAGSEEEQSYRSRPRFRDTPFPAATRTFGPEDIQVPGWLPDLPEVRQEWAEYTSSVDRLDACVGRVLDELERRGLADHTCVVFLSDHGASFPFAKANLWRQSTRTPLIVRWPGVVEPGRRDDQNLLSGVDLAPTLLALAQAPGLAEPDGRSFLPLLEGGADDGFRQAFTSMHETSNQQAYPMRAVHTQQYTYLYNAWSDGTTSFESESQEGLTMAAMRRAALEDPALATRLHLHDFRVREELYDHHADPDGLVNLAQDPASRAILEELRGHLDRQLEATGDPLWERFRQDLRANQD